MWLIWNKHLDCQARELNLPKSRATDIQTLLKYETEDSKLNPKKCDHLIRSSTSLPISGPSFYCRKLSLYNVGVHDCKNANSTCFWGQKIKKRQDQMTQTILSYSQIKVLDKVKIGFWYAFVSSWLRKVN